MKIITASTEFVIQRASREVTQKLGHPDGMIEVFDSDGIRIAFVEDEEGARHEIKALFTEVGFSVTLSD